MEILYTKKEYNELEKSKNKEIKKLTNRIHKLEKEIKEWKVAYIEMKNSAIDVAESPSSNEV